MAMPSVVTDQELAALEGHQVVAVFAQSGEEFRGKLAVFNADGINLIVPGGGEVHLFRHAIGSVRG